MVARNYEMPIKRSQNIAFDEWVDLGVALNAEADITGTWSTDMTLNEQIDAIDEYIEDLTGFERSAHLGGCGGANGEIEDNEAISDNPAILEAAKTFMEIPAVKAYFGVGYDDLLGEQVRKRAGKTAELLRQSGWVGQKYVDGVVKEKPGKVEELVVGDDKFHGHKEKSLLAVTGDKTYPEEDDFVWNLEASKKIAEALAGQRGKEGYTQALIAEVAKHIAVANRLASDKTPILLLSSDE